jgi:hypothetical protein
MPGPPGSPSSAIVTPWRLPAASVSCHVSSRSPPPPATTLATAGSVKTYVAVKLFAAASVVSSAV